MSAAVFTFGHTGSGKSHTLLGYDENDLGIYLINKRQSTNDNQQNKSFSFLFFLVFAAVSPFSFLSSFFYFFFFFFCVFFLVAVRRCAVAVAVSISLSFVFLFYVRVFLLFLFFSFCPSLQGTDQYTSGESEAHYERMIWRFLHLTVSLCLFISVTCLHETVTRQPRGLEKATWRDD